MSGMAAYFIRRLLLVPVTFFAITFMVYTVLRVVPGGPIEQAETAMKLGAMQGESGGRGGGDLGGESELQLDEQGLRELQRYYALDRHVVVGYLQWLGMWPRELRTRVQQATIEREKEIFGALRTLNDGEQKAGKALRKHLAEREQVELAGRFFEKLAEGESLPAGFAQRAEGLVAEGFGKRDLLLAVLAKEGFTWQRGVFYKEVAAEARASDVDFYRHSDKLVRARDYVRAKLRHVREHQGFEIETDGRIYKVEKRFSGIVQLDFGRSYTHGEPVLSLIWRKMEISIQFGLIGYFLSWLVCVPLGVFKALKHRSAFDTLTSVFVFIGYAMPGFVVCLVLLYGVVEFQFNWPLGGYKPDNIEAMGFFEALYGRFRHMLIPVTGYMIGGFATMTILMKNSLLDNLGADYVRTAFAKGLVERRVIFVHALRNSLIPITAGVGHAIGLLFAGSFLIEKTCNIDGMGLLGFEAILQRDYPIILATLVIGVLIRLFGNILSDIVWAAIDPRIRFGS